MISAGNRKSHFSGWLFYWAVAAFTLLLAACAQKPAPVHLSGGTMGTTWTVSYVSSATSLTPTELQQLIEADLAAVNLSMSTYRDDSEISRFNQLAVGEAFTCTEDFLTVLAAALEIGRGSQGAYDITVGPLVNLWGFGPGARSEAVPNQAQITGLLETTGQQLLEVDIDTSAVRKRADVQLDFSSIAKGYAVDAIAELLAGKGITDFLVEVGGEMRLSGLSPRGDAWRIAIEQPSGMGGVAKALSLKNIAVATSGDYRNFFEVDGKRYSHTIDPRSGYPVEHDLVSVTVLHSSAMMADGWATALLVLGAENAEEVAQEQGLAAYFIRRNDQGFVGSHNDVFASYLELDE